MATERKRGRAAQRDRLRIIKRDNGLCQACLRSGHIAIGHEVDHIIGLAQGGTDEDDNKELLCYHCHAAKTAKDNGKRHRNRIGLDGVPIGPGHHWTE